ncbi:MAG: DUF167 domain-containing protein [bacterium]|nr:DUF167 domain-containing protein [bacterium]
MKIFVKAKPGSKLEKVRKVSENHFEISVRERPRDGKANLAILDALAEYFKISKSKLRIVSGHAAKNKIVEIL